MVECKEQDILLPLHMKCTMMKASGPVVFGPCVEVLIKDLVEKHREAFAEIRANARNSVGDLSKKIEILADIDVCYSSPPKLAMVDSDEGITNLHAVEQSGGDADERSAHCLVGRHTWGTCGSGVALVAFARLRSRGFLRDSLQVLPG